MSKNVDIRQVEIVLAVEKHNPILLNPEFLKAKGIVPSNWELNQPPTYTEGIALLAFENGVCIVHRGSVLAFFEDTRTKELKTLEVPQIACRYIEKIPQENYQAVGLNLEGHAAFDTQDAARDSLLKVFFKSVYSHESDQRIVQASTNFIYKLDECVLTLTVKNTGLKISETENIPVILFAANFHRDIAEIPREEHAQTLFQSIDNWQADIKIYKDIVRNKFLL
jgi:hypothetical protein